MIGLWYYMSMTKQNKISNLNKLITDYEKSGMRISDFIREHLFEEYVNKGTKELEEIAAEYFIEKLD